MSFLSGMHLTISKQIRRIKLAVTVHKVLIRKD